MDTFDAIGLLLPVLEKIGDRIIGYDERIRKKFNRALEIALKGNHELYVRTAKIHMTELVGLIVLVKDEPSSVNTIRLPNYINRDEFRSFYNETEKDGDLKQVLNDEWNQYKAKDTNSIVKAISKKFDTLIDNKEEDRVAFEEIKAAIDKLFERLDEMEHRNGDGRNDDIQSLCNYLKNKLEEKRKHHPSFRLMDIDENLFPDGMITFDTEARDSNNEKKKVKEIVAESWGRGETNHLMIEGEGGIGKSVTLLSLPDNFAPHPVPAIYIPLHELKGETNTIKKFIKDSVLDSMEQYDLLQEVVKKPWNEGPNLLLLLDGFNEISIEMRESISEDIEQWSELPGLQIITSSRFDIHQYVALRSNFSKIELQPLSEEMVWEYLASHKMGIPDDPAIIKLVNNPLLLTLFIKAEAIRNDRPSPFAKFKEAKNAGLIIWNYLQCELWRFKNKKAESKACVIAMEFIAPYIAWTMQQHSEFVLDESSFFDRIKEAYHLMEDHATTQSQLPEHISTTLQQSPGLPNVEYIGDLLKEHLCLFINNDGEYRLMHQQFRDALAALHLINSIYLSCGNLPNEWKSPIDNYVMQFVANLISKQNADCLWELNRKIIPTIEDATRNQLWLQGLRNNYDFSELNFSGLDLRNISLFPFRPNNEKILDHTELTMELPMNKDSMNKTKLSDKTFSPEGHEGSVNAVAVTHDGKYIVSGSADKTIRIWSVESGSQIMVLEGHEKDVNAVAVDKEDRYIISGSSDKTIRIWDLETGKQYGKPLMGHEEAVSAVAINEECTRIVSGSFDNTVRVWDFMTRKEIGEAKMKHNSAVSAVAFTSDGQQIVSGSMDNTICLWNLKTGFRVGEPIKGHRFSVSSLALTQDGSRIISGSYDKTIRVWNTESNNSIEKIIECQYGPVFCLASTRDGTRIVSGSGSNYISVWNANTLKSELPPIKGHKSYVNSVAITPDGKRIISGSVDKTIGIWNLNSVESMCTPIKEGHSVTIYSVVVTNNDKYVISRSSDNLIRIWSLKTRTLLHKSNENFTNSLYCIAITKDGNRIVSALRSEITIYDLKTGSSIKLKEERNYPEPKTSSIFRLWEEYYPESKTGGVFRRREVQIIAVDLTPDEKYIVSRAEDGSICIWDLKTGEYIRSLKGHDNSYIEFSFSIDGKKIFGKSYRYTYIWDIETGELQKESGEYDLHGLIQKKRFEATGLDNGIIRITNTESKETQTIRILSISIAGMDFSNSEMSDEVKELFRQNGAKV